MPTVRVLQSDLSAGELGRALAARHDLEVRFQGVETASNFRPMVEGGATKRAGAEFLGAIADAANPAALVPFVVGRDAAFQLEFGNLTLRIRDRTTGDWLEDGGGVIELATPYAAADLDGLYYAQSADVMVFTHADRDQPMKALKRFSNTNWQLDDYEPRDGPFLAENTSNTTLTFPARNGSGLTCAASGNVFSADMVGGLLLVRPPVASLSPADVSERASLWQADKSYSANDYVINEGRVYTTLANGTSGNYAPIHDKGTAWDGGMAWNFVHDGYGVARITGYTSATQVTVDIEWPMPTLLATTKWSEGAFSPKRGYPAVCVFHQERFWVFNTPAQPDTAHASRSSDYDPDGAGFRTETAWGVVSDDDAISATLADGEVNPIVGAISADHLYVFTEKSLKRITGPSPDEAITVSARLAREVSTFACRPRVRPVKAQNSVLYASADGRLLYEYPTLEGPPRDLTVRAPHVGGSPLKQLQWLEFPAHAVYVVREDGRLYSFIFNRQEGIAAWAPVDLGGNFNGAHPVVESISVIPGDDDRDELWMIVKRTVNGSTRRDVERLVREWDGERDRRDEQRYLDGHITVDLWNADTGKTITVTLDSAGADQPGDFVTLEASGHTPFSAGQVGDEVWLRKTSAPVLSTDEPGPLRAKITAFTDGDTVTAELQSSAPAGLLGVALTEWAFAADTVTGLSHLEGEAVHVMADGAHMGPFTVSGGQITLDRPSARHFAGYLYEARIVSLPLEVGAQVGNGMGALKHVEEITVSVMDALGGRVGKKGEAADQMTPLRTRASADPVGRPPAPWTGQQTVAFDASWARELSIDLVHDSPAAFTLRGLAAKVTVNG